MIVANILEAKGHNIFSISGKLTVYEAIRIMGEKNIGALLVMENETLSGILSERDYARKVILKGKASRETLVEEIMTSKVITVKTGATIEECMSVMTKNHIRHLPVVEDTKVTGIISIGDVVNAIIESQKDTIEHLQNYITQ